VIDASSTIFKDGMNMEVDFSWYGFMRRKYGVILKTEKD
jgi:hypothetical protein